MSLLANALVRKTAGLMDMFKVDKAAEIEKAQAVLDDPNTPEHVRRTAQWYVDTHSKELEAEKLKSQAQAALDAANAKGGPVIMKAAAFDDKTDLIQAIPFVGGAIHGLARPARGSSRFESGAIQGIGGMGGGFMGAGVGAGMGAAIMLALFNKAKGDTKGLAAAFGGIAGGLGGAALGTGMGSALGRWMARRETMTPEDWKTLAAQMSEGRQLPKTAQQHGDTPMGLLAEALIRKTAPALRKAGGARHDVVNDLVAALLTKQAAAVQPQTPVATQRYVWKNGKRVQNPAWKGLSGTATTKPKPKQQQPAAGIPESKGGAGAVRQMYKELEK